MNNEDAAINEINELLRAYNESGKDYSRIHVSTYVGNDSEIFFALTCKRGQPEEWNRSYTNWQSTIEEKGGSLPSIQECWFALDGDCGLLDKPIPTPIIPLYDVWSAFANRMVTHGLAETRQAVFAHDCYQDLLTAWKRIRIPYTEAFRRVKAMAIAPRPQGQKYNWYDRTD